VRKTEREKGRKSPNALRFVPCHKKMKKPHKNLDVWKLSMELVKIVYRVTSKFPSSESYGLTSQTHRCTVSIPSNIAEGAARQTKKELINFLHIV
jgi:hypothetical protein